MGQLNCVKYHKGTVGEDYEFQKCLPESRYRRFPSKLKGPPFSLLLEKYVFPRQDYDHFREEQQTGVGSWWSDAQFPPNNDSVLFVTCEPLGQRPFRRDRSLFVDAEAPRLEKPKPLNATSTVVKLLLEDDSCDEEILSKTRSAVYPILCIHPSGSYIGLADDKAIKIEAVNHDEEFINSLADPNGRCLTECLSIAFASDGKQVATLLLRYLDDTRLTSLGFYIKNFDLVVSLQENGVISGNKTLNLDDKVPRFYSDTMQDQQDYIEHMTCKWSPDSKYIAVCSPRSLCLFNRKLKLSVNVISEILKFEMFQTYGFKFDFDPRSCHELPAVGTNDRFGSVYFINSKSKKILKQSGELDSERVECLRYHPFGKYVAVGTWNYSIYLIELADGRILHHLDMREQCPDLLEGPYFGQAVNRLSFSTTGEQLVTATFDAKVRVFQMPVDLSLFDLCKWTIMTLVPQTKLKSLPLPKQVLSKLLAWPAMK